MKPFIFTPDVCSRATSTTAALLVTPERIDARQGHTSDFIRVCRINRYALSCFGPIGPDERA